MKLQNLIHILIGIVCFGLLPKAQALSPAPDGGYPGGNTAEGQSALFSMTNGTYNTAVGFFSLRSDSTGSFNTAIGAGALLFNIADENTATGAAALLSNTTGNSNTANGSQTLLKNIAGNFNTATGFEALYSNTTGDNNTANGYGALVANIDGHENTANGVAALRNNMSGSDNTASGYVALYNNTTGFDNTAMGGSALTANTTGFDNTAVGVNALVNSTIGNGNIALGIGAGDLVFTGTGVIAIGIGGADVDYSCFIGNIRGVMTANADAVPVVIDSDGQLGTQSSSARYKKEIKPMNSASEAILALKPVTFHYKSDGKGTPQFGLIAEEVAEVNPDLVVRDNKGEIYTVRYDAVNAMLLNEFLKEHKAFVEERKKVKKLEAGLAGLLATVKAQAAQIEKVSTQVQMSKPGISVALTGP